MERKITVIDYTSGQYFELYRDFPDDYDEIDIADAVFMNVGVEVE